MIRKWSFDSFLSITSFMVMGNLFPVCGENNSILIPTGKFVSSYILGWFAFLCWTAWLICIPVKIPHTSSSPLSLLLPPPNIFPSPFSHSLKCIFLIVPFHPHILWTWNKLGCVFLYNMQSWFPCRITCERTTRNSSTKLHDLVEDDCVFELQFNTLYILTLNCFCSFLV